MNGVYTIERETSWGDRGIVETIDIDALPNSEVPDKLAYVREAARRQLAQPAVYRVHVYVDNGGSYLRQFSLTAGAEEFATQRER